MIILLVLLTLTPTAEYLGVLPYEVCAFDYEVESLLTPITKLTIEPYSEEYGPGSIVNGGMICGDCWIKSMVINRDMVTTINCEVVE